MKKDFILDFNEKDYLGTTGEKIVADRYLQKGGEVAVGKIVVGVLDKVKSLHEVAKVKEVFKKNGKIESALIVLKDGHEVTLPVEQLKVLKETSPRQMWNRISSGLAQGDKKLLKQFNDLLEDWKYIPGGRINASMGSVDEKGDSVKTTSYNCFVIPNVGPKPEDIAKSFGKTLEIQARSGGVGMNVSFVPPQGTITPQKELNKTDLHLIMEVWHPDLKEFLKEEYPNSTKVVKINEEFKKAVLEDADWTFVFPETKSEKYDEKWNGNLKEWKGNGGEVKEANTVKAAELYEELLKANVMVIENDLLVKTINPYDSRETISAALEEEWKYLLEGKKVSINLSSLRPRYFQVVGVNGYSSGAYSWGTLYDKGNWAYAQGFGPVAVAEIMSTGCLLIIQGGSRRGALMIVLNDWHQDIQKFVNAKRNLSLINGANISVGISDKFMNSKKENKDWDLGYAKVKDFTKYEGEYFVNEKDFVKVREIKPQDLWKEIMEAAHKSAEPGVLFIERSNKISNSWYYNPVIATNPCGEQFLPKYGICNLGAVNLAKFVAGWYDKEIAKQEFKNKKLEKHIEKELLKKFDKNKAELFKNLIKWEELEKTVRSGLRLQDRVIDTTYYPLKENEINQLAERRVGLGFLGLHDMMLYSGVQYGSDESTKFIDVVVGMMAEWCYLESVELAKENGPFEKFNKNEFMKSGFMKQMKANKPHVAEAIEKHGIRNVTTMTIAPTGTTGTMVGVSTGCEPYYAWEYFRNSRLGVFMESADVVKNYQKDHPDFVLGEDFENLPEHFVTSMDLTPEEHVKVQAALQKWIDSSISKTCNAPSTYTPEDVSRLYQQAYDLGCKGVTVYVDGSRDTQVLETKPKKEEVKETEKVEKVVENDSKKENEFIKNKRPQVLYGGTYKKATPHGSAYITINDDPETHLAREIFVNIGQAGSDLFAQNEALGRALTLYLKDSQNPDKESVLVKHFSGIGGQNSVGFGPNRIHSVADAISKAIIEHSENFPLRHGMEQKEFEEMIKKDETSNAKPVEKDIKKMSNIRRASVKRDICPNCQEMTLVNNGGCNECSACGYSKC